MESEHICYIAVRIARGLKGDLAGVERLRNAWDALGLNGMSRFGSIMR